MTRMARPTLTFSMLNGFFYSQSANGDRQADNLGFCQVDTDGRSRGRFTLEGFNTAMTKELLTFFTDCNTSVVVHRWPHPCRQHLYEIAEERGVWTEKKEQTFGNGSSIRKCKLVFGVCVNVGPVSNFIPAFVLLSLPANVWTFWIKSYKRSTGYQWDFLYYSNKPKMVQCEHICLFVLVPDRTWVDGSWVGAGIGTVWEKVTRETRRWPLQSLPARCTHVHTPWRVCAAALMRGPQELLWRLLKERGDVETGQAGVWRAGGGGSVGVFVWRCASAFRLCRCSSSGKV